jgi:hypothetical protein
MGPNWVAPALHPSSWIGRWRKPDVSRQPRSTEGSPTMLDLSLKKAWPLLLLSSWELCTTMWGAQTPWSWDHAQIIRRDPEDSTERERSPAVPESQPPLQPCEQLCVGPANSSTEPSSDWRGEGRSPTLDHQNTAHSQMPFHEDNTITQMQRRHGNRFSHHNFLCQKLNGNWSSVKSKILLSS